MIILSTARELHHKSLLKLLFESPRSKRTLEAETKVATGGQTTDRTGASEIQMNAASVMSVIARKAFCQGGVPEVPHL